MEGKEHLRLFTVTDCTSHNVNSYRQQIKTVFFSFEGPEKRVTDLLEDTCTVRDDTVGKLKQPVWEGVQIPEHAALYPQSLCS